MTSPDKLPPDPSTGTSTVRTPFSCPAHACGFQDAWATVAKAHKAHSADVDAEVKCIQDLGATLIRVTSEFQRDTGYKDQDGRIQAKRQDRYHAFVTWLEYQDKEDDE